MIEKGAILYAVFCFAGGMGASPLTALIRGQFVRGSHERVRKETRPECFRRTAKCLAEFFERKAKKLVG